MFTKIQCLVIYDAGNGATPVLLGEMTTFGEGDARQFDIAEQQAGARASRCRSVPPPRAGVENRLVRFIVTEQRADFAGVLVDWQIAGDGLYEHFKQAKVVTQRACRRRLTHTDVWTGREDPDIDKVEPGRKPALVYVEVPRDQAPMYMPPTLVPSPPAA